MLSYWLIICHKWYDANTLCSMYDRWYVELNDT
jgi:hypothetical protein